MLQMHRTNMATLLSAHMATRKAPRRKIAIRDAAGRIAEIRDVTAELGLIEEALT